ncbi:hypothetical protein AVEN_1979-1 [Araneus ventricosus]|uniref:Uncharacterized protein n=1 Tax=Araneus ventricosus TaxID=182803 RepID=A0A4Y2WTI3_ARAVE|nr:hypothetical protein AVEN_1979-1 [Araneus ventricosus]
MAAAPPGRDYVALPSLSKGLPFRNEIAQTRYHVSRKATGYLTKIH